MAEKINNITITTILVIIIVISFVIYLYVNLPEDESEDNGDISEENGNDHNDESEGEVGIILNVTFGDQKISYTLEELEGLDSYTGDGTLIKVGWLPTVVTEGPNQFTGVEMQYLLDQIDNLPDNYLINVISSDGYKNEFNMSQIQGNIDIYNESGSIVGNSEAIMILAYIMDGEYLTEELGGPLRIVFCNDMYTPSNLWPKMVESIEIVKV